MMMMMMGPLDQWCVCVCGACSPASPVAVSSVACEPAGMLALVIPPPPGHAGLAGALGGKRHSRNSGHDPSDLTRWTHRCVSPVGACESARRFPPRGRE